MTATEYDDRVDALLASWNDDIYGGVLESDVLPAIRIYAHASLAGMTDTYDVDATFPMLPSGWEIYDHYANGLFARLSSACTSIRSALQAIQAHMDCHATIAASRRAHESLWQVFWLCNPTMDADERIKRLLVITKQEIEDTLRYFSNRINPQVEDKLQDYNRNMGNVVGGSRYSAKRGRSEYRDYYRGRFNDPLPEGLPPAPEDVDVDQIVWSGMSNMTHPNVVFDWIIQIQEESQDHMDRLQMRHVIGSMALAANLSTLLMQEAGVPENQVLRVNSSFKNCIVAAQSLIEMQRVVR